MGDNHYMQVSYPQEVRWVAVYMSETRRAASDLAAHAYRTVRNDRGRAPNRLRLVSRGQLVREGGDKAIRRADADILRATDPATLSHGEHPLPRRDREGGS
jgi:hypothetical protein